MACESEFSSMHCPVRNGAASLPPIRRKSPVPLLPVGNDIDRTLSVPPNVPSIDSHIARLMTDSENVLASRLEP